MLNKTLEFRDNSNVEELIRMKQRQSASQIEADGAIFVNVRLAGRVLKGLGQLNNHVEAGVITIQTTEMSHGWYLDRKFSPVP